MTEVQRFQYQEGNETFDIFIETTTVVAIPPTVDKSEPPGRKGIGDNLAKGTAVKMDQARNMIGATRFMPSAPFATLLKRRLKRSALNSA